MCLTKRDKQLFSRVLQETLCEFADKTHLKLYCQKCQEKIIQSVDWEIVHLCDLCISINKMEIQRQKWIKYVGVKDPSPLKRTGEEMIPTKEELQDLVQLTLNEMYAPRTHITSFGSVGISIGDDYKGAITRKEIEVNQSPKAFIALIKRKVEIP